MTKLDERSLEDLCIAVTNLKDSQGFRIALTPKDVLQPWVLEQLPNMELHHILRAVPKRDE